MAEEPLNNNVGNLKHTLMFQLARLKERLQAAWRKVRKPRLFWEITFAVVLAVYFAYYYAGVDRPAYKIYILIGSDIPNTMGPEIRDRLLRPIQFLTTNGNPVKVEIVDIPANKPSAATEAAQTIVSNRDALLVVGVLDSTPTEESLPTYFRARPQIPFIATVQSNNDLLRKCDSDCFDSEMPVPLLQLSPTNADQAKWTVKFATDLQLSRFLIVSDDSSPNQSYIDGLTKAYDKEIPPTAAHFRASVSNVAGQLARKPDCILFAGDPGNAQELLQGVTQAVANPPQNAHKWAPWVILSDTAVPSTSSTIRYSSTVNLTDQSDASYYTDANQPNAYALDGITIAVTLLKELEERGFDSKFWLKSKILNRTDAADIRRNLIRTMQEDIRFHSSYRGSEDTGPVKGLNTVYTFECPPLQADGSIQRKSDGSASYCQRYGGIFHVWRWNPKTKQMTDVDSWHPRRGIGPR